MKSFAKNCSDFQLLLLLFFFIDSFSLSAQTAVWTWMHGTPQVYIPTPNLGTQGIPSPTNTPCQTYEGAEWTDLNGNFWVFGGSAQYDAMWKFDPITNLWVWMSGSPSFASTPVYGIQGVPSPNNFPGARILGTGTWTDLNGNLWLYGGVSISGLMSDLWKYDISTNEWTWMNGPNTANVGYSYGTLGVPSSTNLPPGFSESASTWVDNTTGDLWMYSPFGYFDDMWRYSTTTNEWTWVSGSNTSPVAPNYGTMGVPSSSNSPGSRRSHTRWKDAQGNFWLFSGATTGPPPTTMPADMWMYNPVTLLWTWMGGITGENTTFTQKCVSGGNPQGVFEGRATWVDDCGRLWAMGGRTNLGTMRYTWYYDVITNQFTWVDGPLIAPVSFNPGTITVPAATNTAPPSDGHMPFKDKNGDFWFFGGQGLLFMNGVFKYIYLYPTTTMNSPSIGCAPFTSQFSSTSTGTFNYHWDFGDPSTFADTSTLSSPSWIYTQPGTYTVTLITQAANNNCSPCVAPDTTAQFIIQVDSGFTVDLGPDSILCPNANPIILDAGNPGATYSWNTGATTQTIQPTITGDYSVNVTQGACSDADTIQLRFVEALDLDPQISLCLTPNGVVLDAGNPGAAYNWSTGETTQSILVTNPGTYSVTLISGNCTLSDSSVVEGVPGESILYIPNSFTPNQNGLNEIFTGIGDGITSFQLIIFNRWGEKILETDQVSTGWNGFYAGKLVEEGTYVYIINYTSSCSGNLPIRRMGHVNVIR